VQNSSPFPLDFPKYWEKYRETSYGGKGKITGNLNDLKVFGFTGAIVCEHLGRESRQALAGI
jgi:hypothetical protein